MSRLADDTTMAVGPLLLFWGSSLLFCWALSFVYWVILWNRYFSLEKNKPKYSTALSVSKSHVGPFILTNDTQWRNQVLCRVLLTDLLDQWFLLSTQIASFQTKVVVINIVSVTTDCTSPSLFLLSVLSYSTCDTDCHSLLSKPQSLSMSPANALFQNPSSDNLSLSTSLFSVPFFMQSNERMREIPCPGHLELSATP